MDTRDAFFQAGELIKVKQYLQARAILADLDHPLAKQWLKKIDILIAGKKRETSSELKTVLISPRAASEKRLTQATGENRVVRTTSEQRQVSTAAPAINQDQAKQSVPPTPGITAPIDLIGTLSSAIRRIKGTTPKKS